MIRFTSLFFHPPNFLKNVFRKLTTLKSLLINIQSRNDKIKGLEKTAFFIFSTAFTSPHSLNKFSLSLSGLKITLGDTGERTMCVVQATYCTRWW